MKNDLTLYPSSARDAAADAPASPVPTTMISYLRLLDGLTSLIAVLCLSHFWGSGPGGILASSCMLFYQPRQHRERNRNISEEDYHRCDLRETVDRAGVGLVLQAERLKHGADAMAEVNAQQADA